MQHQVSSNFHVEMKHASLWIAALFFVVTVLLVLLANTLLQQQKERTVNDIYAHESYFLAQHKIEMVSKLNLWIKSSQAIAQSQPLMMLTADAFNSSIAENRFALQHEIENMMQLQPEMMQVRIIGMDGHERFRALQRDHRLLEPEVVLQDKSVRYYTPELLALERGEVYISSIDLNVEHGDIEHPYTPVIRIGFPIYDQDVHVGGLIINWQTKGVLDGVSSSNVLGSQMLFLNGKGWTIYDSRNVAQPWMLDPQANESLAMREPLLWQEIQKRDHGYWLNQDGLYVFETIAVGDDPASRFNHANFVLVSFHSSAILAQEWADYRFLIVVGSIMLILLVLIIGGMRLRFLKQQLIEKQVMVEVNASLDQQLHERTQDLEMINDYHRGILNALNEALFVVDVKGIVRFANPAAAELSGYSVPQLLGLPFSNIDGKKELGDLFDRRHLQILAQHLEKQYNNDVEQFEALLQHSLIPSLLIDQGGRIVFANTLLCDLLGYTMNGLKKMVVDDLIPAPFRYQHAQHRAKFFAQAELEPLPMSERPLLSALHKNGEVVEICISVVNLHLKGELFSFAMLVDAKSRRHEFNLLQYSNFYQLMFAEMEYQLIHQSGKLIPVSYRSSILYGHDHFQLGGVITAVDLRQAKMIAEEREAFAQTQAQNERVQSLGIRSSGVAHDFKNLLTPIMGHAELLLDDDPDGHAKAIVEASRHADRLCRQLLVYAGKGRANVEVVELDQFVDGMKGVLHGAIAPHVQLVLEMSPLTHQVQIDLAQMEQLLLNIVVNASDAMGSQKKGVVRVAIAEHLLEKQDINQSHFYADADLKRGEYAVLTVSDEGQGMSDSVLSHLFDPFFTTKKTGHGLGMAAILGIVKGHHGYLRVQSTEGEGTTFTVGLPLAAEAKRRRVVKPLASKSLVLHRSLNLLLIDDDALIVAVTEAQLKKLGCLSQSALSGEEGLDLFHKHHHQFDGVLLDMNMAGISGPECLLQLRAIDPLVKVIMVSGTSADVIRDEFDHLDRLIYPDGYLCKPYSQVELIDVLNHISVDHAVDALFATVTGRDVKG
ncbi:MAG: PAS domain S-box protein [Zetaproteobacteria bacterium]|nr:PAS domain S-box protein [Zetaproteobacteria bacterium]